MCIATSIYVIFHVLPFFFFFKSPNDTIELFITFQASQSIYNASLFNFHHVFA